MNAKINITPTFMKECIKGWHTDLPLFRAVRNTEEIVFGTRGEDTNLEQICGRPKTPQSIYNLKGNCRSWLARHFRPVSDALFDGKSDEEALKIWMNTDRKTLESIAKDWKDSFVEDARTKYISARSLHGTHGSFFRKK